MCCCSANKSAPKKTLQPLSGLWCRGVKMSLVIFYILVFAKKTQENTKTNNVFTENSENFPKQLAPYYYFYEKLIEHEETVHL